MLGKETDMARYILMNTENPNPYHRILPATKIDSAHNKYDKRKYSLMVRRAAWNLLRPFIPDEGSIGAKIYEKTQLDFFT
jgi:hypothetical protein